MSQYYHKITIFILYLTFINLNGLDYKQDISNLDIKLKCADYNNVIIEKSKVNLSETLGKLYQDIDLPIDTEKDRRSLRDYITWDLADYDHNIVNILKQSLDKKSMPKKIKNETLQSILELVEINDLLLMPHSYQQSLAHTITNKIFKDLYQKIFLKFNNENIQEIISHYQHYSKNKVHKYYNNFYKQMKYNFFHDVGYILWPLLFKSAIKVKSKKINAKESNFYKKADIKIYCKDGNWYKHNRVTFSIVEDLGGLVFRVRGNIYDYLYTSDNIDYYTFKLKSINKAYRKKIYTDFFPIDGYIIPASGSQIAIVMFYYESPHDKRSYKKLSLVNLTSGEIIDIAKNIDNKFNQIICSKSGLKITLYQAEENSLAITYNLKPVLKKLDFDTLLLLTGCEGNTSWNTLRNCKKSSLNIKDLIDVEPYNKIFKELSKNMLKKINRRYKLDLI